MNNKPNKSATRLISLSSNKQMDGRSQVLEDEWRHQLAGFIHTHFTGFVYISTLKNETPHLPNVSQTPPYRAGLLLNIKQGMVDKHGVMIEEVTHRKQQTVRDSENGSEGETRQQKKSPEKETRTLTAELSNIWQCWKLLCLSQSFPLQLPSCFLW